MVRPGLNPGRNYVDGDPKDPAVYLHTIETQVPIELEALSYHSCPFVRARVAGRSKRIHVLERLAHDCEPSVVANVVDNPHCPPTLVEAIADRMTHSSEREHIVWYVLIQHLFTPHWIRAKLKKKEAERRLKIKKKLGIPIPPPVPPPPPVPLTKMAQRRVILRILKIEFGRRLARVTPAGVAYYRAFGSKLVDKAIKKYVRRVRYLKSKRKARRNVRRRKKK